MNAEDIRGASFSPQQSRERCGDSQIAGRRLEMHITTFTMTCALVWAFGASGVGGRGGAGVIMFGRLKWLLLMILARLSFEFRQAFRFVSHGLCQELWQTEEAMALFSSMGMWGRHPDEIMFLLLIKSLYQAARVGGGDEMIDRIKSAGYGDALDKKAYYEFLKILCGIERIDHAMNVFGKMKEDCEPGIKTYDLLIQKLCAHGRSDKANAIYKEAKSSGLPIERKEYKVDSRFVKKIPTLVKKEKKRETFPEKMASKRRRLKQIRLSFVNKPKKMRLRA